MSENTFSDRQEARKQDSKNDINEKSSAGHWIQKMRDKLKPNIKPHLQIWNQDKWKRENEEYYLIPADMIK